VAVAEKIRTLIAATPFATRGGDAPVTVSFGVASTGAGGPDLTLKADSLIRLADECLYRSKRDGRDRTYGHEFAKAAAPLKAIG
jgi:PleD family two-component response regulator